MKELTIVLDQFSHNELNEYLKSLNGVIDVIIDRDKYLKIDIKYDDKLLNDKILLNEIVAFLDTYSEPDLVSFDKHSKEKLDVYHLKTKICCDMCFKIANDKLFEIEGIEKVESKFWDDSDISKEIVIDIYYNPKKICLEKMKEIEKELDL